MKAIIFCSVLPGSYFFIRMLLIETAIIFYLGFGILGVIVCWIFLSAKKDFPEFFEKS